VMPQFGASFMIIIDDTSKGIYGISLKIITHDNHNIFKVEATGLSDGLRKEWKLKEPIGGSCSQINSHQWNN
jgi:hypothetical protein